jgi:aspartate ammonia-lyase
MTPNKSIGIEHDLIGNPAISAQAYYGVHTLRALHNFPITGTPISIYPDLINALACVKHAAAVTNHELGLIDEARTSSRKSEACKVFRRMRFCHTTNH